MLDVTKFFLTGAGLVGLCAKDQHNKERGTKRYAAFKSKQDYLERFADRELYREMDKLISSIDGEETIYEMVGDNLKEIYGDDYRNILKYPYPRCRDLLTELLLSKSGHTMPMLLRFPYEIYDNPPQEWIDMTYQIQKNLQAHGINVSYGITIEHKIAVIDGSECIVYKIEEKAKRR